ncbi:dTDP-4-dehydrorhamnose reductase [Candidatus Magnetaquicoccaceae bacterium FCR-1]|uniref:dTDP-4-dehydrorhamnose reductase n=1 Tax=Candidatus Magnetaquiglobus chichijimensis TaxID=3141448 RepID=A0ABQ0C5S2_9PROT
MKLLITGAQGQVGQEIVALAAQRNLHPIPLGRNDLDITDPQAVRAALEAHRPDLAINAAAYTAVDLAESQPDAAFAVNRDGARHLASACAAMRLPLIHLSTDYIFDGRQSTPYRETDPPAPLGLYGVSKWEGEEAIRALLPHHLIIRVSWVFGLHGKNFVKTILRLARERESLAVVDDQTGGPTAADDIARMLLEVAGNALQPGFSDWGTYHYQGAPAVTWHAFARFIVATAGERITLPVREIRPIPTEEFPTPAQRPANSRLDCQRIHDRLGIAMPDWRLAARTLIPRLLD